MLMKVLALAVCAIAFAGALAGYLAGRLSAAKRVTLFLACCALIPHSVMFNSLGTLLLVVILAWQVFSARRNRRELRSV
jgi:TRAP-type uncharacterized transport system fused permease subunit